MNINMSNTNKITNLLKDGKVKSSRQIGNEMNLTPKQAFSLLNMMRNQNLIDCYCDAKTHLNMWFLPLPENADEILKQHELNESIRHQELLDKYDELILVIKNQTEQNATVANIIYGTNAPSNEKIEQIEKKLDKIIQLFDQTKLTEGGHT